MTIVDLADERERREPFDPEFEEFNSMINEAQSAMAHEMSKAILPIFRKYGREAAFGAMHLIVETMLEGLEQ